MVRSYNVHLVKGVWTLPQLFEAWAFCQSMPVHTEVQEMSKATPFLAPYACRSNVQLNLHRCKQRLRMRISYTVLVAAYMLKSKSDSHLDLVENDDTVMRQLLLNIHPHKLS